MRRLLFLFMLMLVLPVFGQLPIRRNFFTTNVNPIVNVLAGSNTTVQASITGTDQRHFTVNSQTDTNVVNALIAAAPGTAKETEAGTNIIVVTNAGSFTIHGKTDTNVVNALIVPATNAIPGWIQQSTNDLNTALENKIQASTNAVPGWILTATNDLNTAVGQKRTDSTNDLNTALTAKIQSATNVANLGAMGVSTNHLVRTVGVTVDGAGSAIAAGTKGYISVPYAGTIQSCTIMASPSGSIEFRIWRTNSVDGSFPPTAAGAIGTNSLTSDNYAVDSTLSNWTTALNAGDVLAFNVPAAATSITNCTLQLKIQP